MVAGDVCRCASTRQRKDHRTEYSQAAKRPRAGELGVVPVNGQKRVQDREKKSKEMERSVLEDLGQ